MSEKKRSFTRDRSIPKSYELGSDSFIYRHYCRNGILPPLGFIPLVVINATIIHIPVILGAIFCGPKKVPFGICIWINQFY